MTLIPHSCPCRRQKDPEPPSKFYREAPGSIISLNLKHLSYNSEWRRRPVQTHWAMAIWLNALGEVLSFRSSVGEVRKAPRSHQAHPQNDQTEGPNQHSQVAPAALGCLVLSQGEQTEVLAHYTVLPAAGVRPGLLFPTPSGRPGARIC